MASAKNIVFSYTTAKTLFSVITQEETGYKLDQLDGAFKATLAACADPYCNLAEDPLEPGRYTYKTAATAWQDGPYTATIYEQAGASPSLAVDLAVGSVFMLISGDLAAAAGPSPASGSRTLAQIISLVRRLLTDDELPYLWGNDELTGHVDRLQKELVEEMPILVDRDTATTCDIEVVQGDGAITIDRRIINVRKARLDGATKDLTVLTADDMDYHYSNWDKGTVEQAEPHTLVVGGLGPGKAYLFPPLLAATATVKMRVVRAPLLDLDYAQHLNEYLEIDRYHHLIINGILEQAYRKPGADTENLKRAEEHRKLWVVDREAIRRRVLRERPVAGRNHLHEGWV